MQMISVCDYQSYDTPVICEEFGTYTPKISIQQSIQNKQNKSQNKFLLVHNGDLVENCHTFRFALI